MAIGINDCSSERTDRRIFLSVNIVDGIGNTRVPGSAIIVCYSCYRFSEPSSTMRPYIAEDLQTPDRSIDLFVRLVAFYPNDFETRVAIVRPTFNRVWKAEGSKFWVEGDTGAAVVAARTWPLSSELVLCNVSGDTGSISTSVFRDTSKISELASSVFVTSSGSSTRGLSTLLTILVIWNELFLVLCCVLQSRSWDATSTSSLILSFDAPRTFILTPHDWIHYRIDCFRPWNIWSRLSIHAD